MLAASALAGPNVPADTGAANTAPAYKFVPGDTDKVPSASTAPAYQPQIGDALMRIAIFCAAGLLASLIVINCGVDLNTGFAAP